MLFWYDSRLKIAMRVSHQYKLDKWEVGISLLGLLKFEIFAKLCLAIILGVNSFEKCEAFKMYK